MDFTTPEKPLNVHINNKANELQAEKTYFYERSNGEVFPVTAKEAWDVHKKFKQVGVSNGLKYQQAIKEAQKLFLEQGIEVAQARLRKGLEEELEVAKGRLETPPNTDVTGNGAAYLLNNITKYGLR